MALIDIETIRAEIERRRNKWLAESRLIKKGRDVAMYAAGKSSAYAEFLSYLDTLPEQAVTDCHDLEEQQEDDLEKEVTKFVLSKEYIEGKETPVLLTARHFYDLGCRHTAEMYDEIEYNRQRAKEATISKGLEEEIKRMVYDVVYDLDGPAIKGTSEYLSVEDIAYIARHFAEWGAEHLKR